MALRCPDATDPIPATLADHDWLINERGVATVEPFTGSCVQWGAVAGVRPRPGHPMPRRRCYRYTADRAHRFGPSLAWVTPIPGSNLSRLPGYLERIIDGARHHGCRIAGSPTSAPLGSHLVPITVGRRDGAAPQNTFELLADPAVIELSRLRSRPASWPSTAARVRADDGRRRARGRCGRGVGLPVATPPKAIRTIYRRLPFSRGVGPAVRSSDHADVVVSVQYGYGRIGAAPSCWFGWR